MRFVFFRTETELLAVLVVHRNEAKKHLFNQRACAVLRLYNKSGFV